MNKESLKVWVIVTGIVIFLWLIVWVEQSFSATMLEKAKPYTHIFQEVVHKYWTDVKSEHYMLGQTEQESRWIIRAELKTSREYGFGFAQITVTDRFNNFLEAKKNIKALSAWSWENRFEARYQFIYLVLTDKSNFTKMKFMKTTIDKWAGALVCYNAGTGTVIQRRALCKQTLGCQPDKWFDGLDSVEMNYEKKLLYGRELGKMRNEYPELVIKKAGKYKCLLG
jgi:hypothetical protein